VLAQSPSQKDPMPFVGGSVMLKKEIWPWKTLVIPLTLYVVYAHDEIPTVEES